MITKNFKRFYTMKKNFYQGIGMLLVAALCGGCSDFFDVQSSDTLDAANHQINTEDKAMYALFGIWQQLQTVADRYVVLGELQADLLTTTQNATQELRDICRFQADSLNSYHLEADLYEIINSCNYLISRTDTSVTALTEEGEPYKVLKYEVAQATAVRCWCYMQLASLYGEAWYYTASLLTTDAEEKLQAPLLSMEQLLPQLAAELQPWIPVNEETAESFPAYGTVGNYACTQMCLPARLVLGDIYLWMNRYEEAAQLYYAHLLSNKLTVYNNCNAWNNGTFSKVSTTNWSRLFETAEELQSLIQCDEDYADNSSRLSMLLDEDYLLAPSTHSISLFNEQTYAYSANVSYPGDLRGPYGTYEYRSSYNGIDEVEQAYVTKYKKLEQTVLLYRTSTVYLRYAEALNRLGKPNMAFAMLKYGLNRSTLTTATYVPATEWQDPAGKVIDWCDFGQSSLLKDEVFGANIGMHSRGCGNLALFKSYCIESGTDSIQTVEEMLLTEMALETAFEGNRLTDLQRIARHRNSTDFFAQKVAAKFSATEAAAIEARLSDPTLPLLPHQGKRK